MLVCGNNSITKVISVRDACENDFFNALTNCSFAEWTWSADNDAITVLYPDGVSVYSIGAAADCQAEMNSCLILITYSSIHYFNSWNSVTCAIS